MVRNQDIGFARAGEPAEIKIDTLNFTRYGLQHGTVVSVAEDGRDGARQAVNPHRERRR